MVPALLHVTIPALKDARVTGNTLMASSKENLNPKTMKKETNPIVYTTGKGFAINENIIKAYDAWRNFGMALTNASTKAKNRLWIAFCKECEMRGESPLEIIDIIK